MYDTDITPLGSALIHAVLRFHPIVVHRSPDPEHDLCFEILKAGLPDGAIQFWRGTTSSLRFGSVHKTAGYRIALGDHFPERVKRKAGAPSECAKVTHHATQDGHSAPGGYLRTTEPQTARPE